MLGNKVSGRYEILERVGGGGMAVVYKAKDALLDRIVALKVLRPQYAIDDDFVQRFRREAQSAARLSHPNIVSIYDVGVDDDTHFIVMEYVEGKTLKQHINEESPLELEDAVNISIQIAEALDHAHHNQIIHRDIKPHNILITQNKKIKVTDFGIARAVSSATITHTGSVIGSVHYFSPEQARGSMTGEKSDLYSLGIVMYEMLTGRLPFSGDSPISVALKHLQESYTEPSSLNSRIPQSIENIILKCLSKDPNGRFASAKELISNLQTALNPERLNESKVYIPQKVYETQLETEEDVDDQQTKIIPKVKLDQPDFPHATNHETKIARPDRKQAQRKRQNQDDEDYEFYEEDEKRVNRRVFWIKFSISIIVIALVAYGSMKLYQGVMALLGDSEIVVADVTNKPFEEAKEILEEQGFTVNPPRRITSNTVEEDYVINQVPVGNSVARKGQVIMLTVSIGKDKVTMDNFINSHEQAVKRMLQGNFKDVDVRHEAHDEIQAGNVIRHEPAAGEEVVPEDTVVVLYVSLGKSTTEMPNLINETLDVARVLLTRHNLELDPNIEYGYSEYEKDRIYRQMPVDPGQEVEPGTPIKVWISLGLKDQYKVVTEPIFVPIGDEASKRVSIIVTDVDGEERPAYVTEIYANEEFPVEVKVSPERDAIIRVFVNGSPFETKRVTFSD